MSLEREAWSGIRAFLESCNVGVPPDSVPLPGSWGHACFRWLVPLWQAHPRPLEAPEWSIPYAALIGDLLRRLVEVAHPPLSGQPRDILVPLMAPPGTLRQLRQTQQNVPLPYTLAALDEANALEVLTLAGYLPPSRPRSRALFLSVRSVAEWQRPRAPGAEPLPVVAWRDTALWLEVELELPYFVELTFPGAPMTPLADEHRAALLSGRLHPCSDGSWEADWLRVGQYVIERAGFVALLRGLVTDWYAWHCRARGSRVRQWWTRLWQWTKVGGNK